MDSERVEFRLGDVCTKIGSGATPRGGSSVYLATGEIALIRSQNVHNDGFQHDGLAFITPAHADQLGNVEVLPGDVLLNITGDSVARCCQVDPSVLPARVNQHVAIIRTDALKLDPLFLRYALVSPQLQGQLLSWAAAGGTRNALTKEMIEDLVIAAPRSPSEQRAIAHILGTLDDKIELNRRMNATLEGIARAIFRSWFVDFDPVRAKAEERDPGLPKHLAELFPDRFVESELGEIPEGWKVCGLDSIATFRNGLPMQRYPATGGDSLPVIKIAQLRSGDTTGADQASTDVPPEYVVEDGDTLFSWSGSLQVSIWCGGRGALNQHLFKVTSNDCPRWFYYLWALRHLPQFRRIAADKATTMGHIQRRHLSEALVVVPPARLLCASDSCLAPLIDRAISASIESHAIAETRDTLLPKLISGELSVVDAEHIVGEHT